MQPHAPTLFIRGATGFSCQTMPVSTAMPRKPGRGNPDPVAAVRVGAAFGCTIAA
jgi:hypothetical protein